MKKRLEKDTMVITPNEMNKFTYCPYQWYYERYYGAKKLRELAKGKKAAPPAKGAVKRTGNFARGNEFHAQIHKRYKKDAEAFKVRLFFIVVLTLLILILAVLIWGWK